jgi:hypothetical protein
MTKVVHILILFGVIGILCSMIIRLFFSNLEKGVALDGAKSSIELQKGGLTSLEIFVNESIKDCHIKVTDFERLIRIKYGANIYWNEEDGSWFVSGQGLKVLKKGSCIEVVRFTWSL